MVAFSFHGIHELVVNMVYFWNQMLNSFKYLTYEFKQETEWLNWEWVARQSDSSIVKVYGLEILLKILLDLVDIIISSKFNTLKCL